MGNEHCMDGDRLCSSRRVRQDRREEQEYLEKHNPRRFPLIEIALLLLVAALIFDAVRIVGLKPNASVPLGAATAKSLDGRDYPEDWESFGYDIDLLR